MTASLDADADVDTLELFPADEQHGLEDLVPQGLRLEQLDRVAVHLQDADALLAVCNSDSIFLYKKTVRKSFPELSLTVSTRVI